MCVSVCLSDCLKNCATQLGMIFSLIFQLFLDSHVMPRAWKTSTIIPVPKKATPLQLNDYRPVAVTPIIAKCFENVVSKHLKFDVVHQLDPFQFAYKASRGVEDASLTLLSLITQHLDKAKSDVRILFVDFSSAFNTIEPYVLLKRLIDLHVNSNLVLWIRDFLRDRPQRVCVNGYLSEEVVLNSGAPQGCVLPPMLFSIYTIHMNLQTAVTCLFKFADDMALVGLLLDEDSLATYFSHISLLNEWCEKSFLETNVGNTKELVLDARKHFLFICSCQGKQ